MEWFAMGKNIGYSLENRLVRYDMTINEASIVFAYRGLKVVSEDKVISILLNFNAFEIYLQIGFVAAIIGHWNLLKSLFFLIFAHFLYYI